MMNFTDVAVKLCGHSAVLLGWKPGEFWQATPAELGCVLSAVTGQNEAPPDSADIQMLMNKFPDSDARTEVDNG
jgi:uncharacterized phage protein (TIGR02216 family)